jgi:hypothetical protein
VSYPIEFHRVDGMRTEVRYNGAMVGEIVEPTGQPARFDPAPPRELSRWKVPSSIKYIGEEALRQWLGPGPY